MYCVGDKIVHPMHGAGVVEDIIEKDISGNLRTYYVLRLPVGGMMVMIPTMTSSDIGVRPVMQPEQADGVIEFIKNADVAFDTNWNKRYRDNMLRIKSGEAIEVAKVIKSLAVREQEKGLSTGERKMLHSAKQILISEMVLAKSESYDQIENKVDEAVHIH